MSDFEERPSDKRTLRQKVYFWYKQKLLKAYPGEQATFRLRIVQFFLWPVLYLKGLGGKREFKGLRKIGKLELGRGVVEIYCSHSYKFVDPTDETSMHITIGAYK